MNFRFAERIESGTRSISVLIFASSLFPGRFDYHYLVLIVISNRGKKAMEIVLQITFTRYSFLSRGKIKIERKKKNQIFHFVSWD